MRLNFRWALTHIVCTLGLSHIGWAQGTEIKFDPNKAMGVPFSKTPKAPDDSEISRDIFERLSSFTGWQDYSTRSANKAVAIQYAGCFTSTMSFSDWGEHVAPMVLYYGGSWEYEDVKGAKDAAIAECQKSFQSGAKDECTTFLVNDDPEPRKALINKIRVDCERYQATEVAKAQAEFKRAKAEIVLTRAKAENRKDGTKRPFLVSQRVNATTEVDYQDRVQDYASACWDRVFYVLIPLTGAQKLESLKTLKVLQQTSYYGQYMRTLNTTLDYRNPRSKVITSRMAHFVEFGETSEDSLPVLPKNLRDALIGEQIQRVWLEGSVHLSAQGLPLSVEGPRAPVAIQTNRGFYLGVEIRMPPPKGGCNVSRPFANPVLDYSVCHGDMTCRGKAVQEILNSISESLQRSPFSAKPSLNEPLGPGEISLERAYEHSEVLGAPYYELSTYSVHTWTADSDHPLFNAYANTDYMGTAGTGMTKDDGNRLILFLKLEHVLTATPNKNGKYSEPENSQVKKYDDLVAQAVLESVKDACKKLNGSMHGNICVAQ